MYGFILRLQILARRNQLQSPSTFWDAVGAIVVVWLSRRGGVESLERRTRKWPQGWPGSTHVWTTTRDSGAGHFETTLFETHQKKGKWPWDFIDGRRTAWPVSSL